MDSDVEQSVMEKEEEEKEEEEEEEEQVEEQEEEEEEALWAETEAIFHTVSALQEQATQRMNALLLRLSTNWVTTCHEASLEDVKRTGEVTFGQRLLQKLKEGEQGLP
jgi:hypothetical protein